MTSLYVDEVVRTGVADETPDLFDTNRIEVLKGPQGTLFGRNSEGGVVSIHTNDPVFQPEYVGEATYGNYNLTDVKAMLNTPLIDGVLAGRLVLTSRWRDGYIEDKVLAEDLMSENRQSLRGKLLFTPTDNLRGILTVDYLHSYGSRGNEVTGNFTPILDPPAYGKDVSDQASPGSNDNQSWGVIGKVDLTTALGTLTSISAYRDVREHQSDSASADPLIVTVQTVNGLDTQFTQELRFASELNGRFNFISGLYFLDSNKNRPIDFRFDNFPGSFFASVGLGGVIPSIVRQNTHTISLGAFGEGTYAFTEQLKLTVGARFTRDSKSGSGLIDPSATLTGSLISAAYDHSWTASTPKFTLSYKPFNALATYATVSKGFQSGGFNTQGSSQSSLATPFLPSFVWNYEVGVKVDTANHRFQSNVSAFVDRYSQLQIITYDTTIASSTTTNAGKAKIQGVESDLTALPFDWLSLGLAYTRMDGKFTSYVVDNGPGVPPSDYTGNTVPYVPTNSVTPSVELHVRPLVIPGRIDVGADYTYRSSMQLDAPNDLPKFIIDKTIWNGMINAHGTWSRDDDHLSVSFWGKNLRNIDYTTSASGNIAVFYATPAELANPNNQIFITRPITPRTFGVTVRAKF
jgi:iron complex outermembrane receptor protein